MTNADGVTTETVTLTLNGVDITATANTYTTDEEVSITGNLMTDGTADSDTNLSSGNIISSGLILHFDASQDNAGDDFWENTTASDFAWDLDSVTTNGSFSANAVTSAYPGITHAYSFNVNPDDSSGASFSDGLGTDDESFTNLPGDPSNDSATFELWFQANDISDHDVLFETGATGDGASIRIDGTVLEFYVKDSSANVQLSFDLALIGIDPRDEFVQVAGVINVNGHIELYVNGALAAQDTSGVISDWSGSNDSGLAFNNEGINFGASSMTAFEGQISSFNFYESALSSSDVLTNFQAIAGLSVSEVNGSAISLYNPITLPGGGSIIISGDGSYLYSPATDFSGTETFDYAIANVFGETDSATVSIDVQEMNDGPIVSSNALTVDEESTDNSLGLSTPIDPEGDVYTITVTGLPLLGVVTLADGSPVINGQTLTSSELTGLLFDAPTDYNGVDAVGNFIYTADDGRGDPTSIQTGTVSIIVTPIVDPGSVTATDDANATDEDVAVVGNVITNTDPNGLDFDSGLTIGSPVSTNLTLHFDASADADGGDSWSSSPTNNFVWDFDGTGGSGSFSPSPVTSSLVGITQAYSFNVNASDSSGAVFSNDTGDDDSFQDMSGNPTNNSASFELWVRANDTDDHDVLFEAGANVDGTSIRLNGTVIEFFVKDGGSNALLSFDLNSVGIDPTAEFFQITGVINTGGNVELYINGALAAVDTSGVIADWAGSNDAGLGATNSAINFGTPTAFEGQIAIFNFYESALSSDDVLTNYQAISGLAVTEVNGEDVSLNAPIALTNGSLIIAADGSYQYTPNANYFGQETFTYTLENVFGQIDTATVTIDILPVNDPPEVTVNTNGDVDETSTSSFDQEFDASDFPSISGTDYSDATGTNPANLTLDHASNIEINFISESAGFNNTVGWYHISPEGVISTASILWANSNSVAAGEVTQHLNDVPEGQIGFFLLGNGFSGYGGIISNWQSGIGVLRFENASGNLATTDDVDINLVYYTAGDEVNPSGVRTVMTESFHATYANFNPDGLVHSVSGLDNGDENSLVIGFEDLYAANPENPNIGVDWDLRDFVLSVRITSVELNVSDILSSPLDIIDDGTELISAAVRITLGRDTDDLLVSDATETLAASYGIALDYDSDTKELSLIGTAAISEYEDILSAVQLGSAEALGSDPRTVEYSVTDVEGLSSSLASVQLNANPSYDYAENDFIAGGTGNDLLFGLDGDDIIFGSTGSDELSGGDDSNTFIWKAGDADNSTDTITDFTSGVGGDILDFSDLLQGEDSDNIDQYLTAIQTGPDEITLEIDVSGDGGSSDLSVVLQGVDLAAIGVSDINDVVQKLIDDGNVSFDR